MKGFLILMVAGLFSVGAFGQTLNNRVVAYKKVVFPI